MHVYRSVRAQIYDTENRLERYNERMNMNMKWLLATVDRRRLLVYQQAGYTFDISITPLYVALI